MKVVDVEEKTSRDSMGPLLRSGHHGLESFANHMGLIGNRKVMHQRHYKPLGLATLYCNILTNTLCLSQLKHEPIFFPRSSSLQQQTASGVSGL